MNSRPAPDLPALFTLTGQVALITGATRGIGLATARLLAQAGAAVVVSSEDAKACEDIAARLRNEGHHAIGIACDVSQKTQIESLATRAHAAWGRIDILVCNAGIAPHMGPIASATDEHYEQTMTVNLRSVLWLTNQVIPLISNQGGGSIVLMASIAGIRGNHGLGIYSLSKAALASLARNLAVEWGSKHVRVNSISPGVIQTEFARGLTDNNDVLQRRLALTPLRRVGRPEEIAGAVLYLASPAGAFVTGHNLVIDGGTTIGDGN